MKIPNPIGWILWKLKICIKVVDDVDIKRYSTSFSSIPPAHCIGIEYKITAHHYEFKKTR